MDSSTPPGHNLGGSAALTPEAMRKQRLERFGGGMSEPPRIITTRSIDQDEEADLQAALVLSMQTQARHGERNSSDTRRTPPVASKSAFDLTRFRKIMWDDLMTTDSDRNRWVQQGIDVRKNDEIPESLSDCTILEALARSHLPWGLIQEHGGPCGVMAAVQAELLRELLSDSHADLSETRVISALAHAIAVILARAALTPSAVNGVNPVVDGVRIVLPGDTTNWQDHLLDDQHGEKTVPNLWVHSIPMFESGSAPKRQKMQDDVSLHGHIQRVAEIVEAFLLHPTTERSPLDHLRGQGGVVLLVMSLTESRTINIIQEEFDDPVGTRLTAQFGHCGQELMNLLLTGQAVSNVFDNTLSPSGDMVCRGIQSRPAIGYLSQLEAMRYCEVGGYYKAPLCPIWVVGSTSHFTVLFGDSAALKESKSDVLLDECRRAFKSVEGGEENGFIRTDQLGEVLKKLNVILGGESQDEASSVQALGASLEVSGANLILWDDFWKACSRLMTGASLETVLHNGGTSIENAIAVGDDNSDEPMPLLLTNYASNAPTNETDEELARRLGAEWGSSGMDALTTAAVSATPLDTTEMTDEEYARRLQDQFDAEIGGESSVAAVNGSPAPTDDNSTVPTTTTQLTNAMDQEEDEDDGKPAAQNTMEFEQFGDCFPLYHYNGLRGGVLTPFRVTRLTPEEAVGASIALNKGSHGSSGSQDLEDVVRTKWPSCSINWLGKQPPYID